MANIEEGHGLIPGRSQYNALLALKAAELAGEDASVVRTTSDGYTVPDNVYDHIEAARKELNDKDFDDAGDLKVQVPYDGNSLHDDATVDPELEAPDGGAGAAGVAAAERDEANADRDSNTPVEEHPSQDEEQSEKKPTARKTAAKSTSKKE